MSRLTEFLYKKFIGFPEVLPYHLRNWRGTGRVKLHTDWPWLANKIPRSWNARGPRAKLDSPGYAEWPPKLVEGFDVTRFENAGASSILWIPGLARRHVSANDIYGKTHRVTEMNPGHPEFMKDREYTFPAWRPSAVWEVPTGEVDQWGVPVLRTVVSPNDYSPSALQKFSMGSGFMNLDPKYTLRWKVLSKREWPWKADGMGPDGEDRVLMYRDHFRPDHLDIYYNVDKTPLPAQLALHWE